MAHLAPVEKGIGFVKSIVKIAAFIFVFAAVITSIHFGGLFLFEKDPEILAHHGVGQVTFYLLFILNVFLFQKYVNRQSVVSLGLKRYPGWPVTVFKGWLAGGIAFLGYVFLMSLFGIVELRVDSWTKFWLNFPVALMVACAAFGIALTEDVLFRGFFFQTLLQNVPKWPSIVITGIIFGFFHKLNQPLDFFTLPYDAMLFGGVFCLNVLLCFAFLKSGTLYLPIGIHSGLVFAKIACKKLKFIHVLQSDSFLFGLGGDPRRGFFAWGLFLAGIFILQFLISSREPKVSHD